MAKKNSKQASPPVQGHPGNPVGKTNFSDRQLAKGKKAGSGRGMKVRTNPTQSLGA